MARIEQAGPQRSSGAISRPTKRMSVFPLANEEK
jgi:hypothetical protein